MEVAGAWAASRVLYSSGRRFAQVGIASEWCCALLRNGLLSLATSGRQGLLVGEHHTYMHNNYSIISWTRLIIFGKYDSNNGSWRCVSMTDNGGRYDS